MAPIQRCVAAAWFNNGVRCPPSIVGLPLLPPADAAAADVGADVEVFVVFVGADVGADVEVFVVYVGVDVRRWSK